MAPVEEPSGGAGADIDDDKAGGLGAGSSSYVPPHLRGKAGAAGGEKMGGRFEKDDLATLRVTNVRSLHSPAIIMVFSYLNYSVTALLIYQYDEQVSELAEENELRDLFERFGRVTRVFLARDRETQRAKGFAFISYADRGDAQLACDKMDGCMFSPDHARLDQSGHENETKLTHFASRLPPPYSSRRIRQALYLKLFRFLIHDMTGFLLFLLFQMGFSPFYPFVLYDR